MHRQRHTSAILMLRPSQRTITRRVLVGAFKVPGAHANSKSTVPLWQLTISGVDRSPSTNSHGFNRLWLPLHEQTGRANLERSVRGRESEEPSHVRRKSDRLEAVPVGITNIRRRYAPPTVRDGCHGDEANVATDVRSSPTLSSRSVTTALHKGRSKVIRERLPNAIYRR